MGSDGVGCVGGFGRQSGVHWPFWPWRPHLGSEVWNYMHFWSPRGRAGNLMCSLMGLAVLVGLAAGRGCVGLSAFLTMAPSFGVGGVAGYTFLESSWPDEWFDMRVDTV